MFRLTVLVGAFLAIAWLTGCVIEEQVDVSVRFQPDGGRTLTCGAANVAQLEIGFYSRGFPDVAYTRYTGPCSDDPIELMPDPGFYELQVRGLDPDGNLCYLDRRPYEVEVETTYEVDWVVAQAPTGIANGCTYP